MMMMMMMIIIIIIIRGTQNSSEKGPYSSRRRIRGARRKKFHCNSLGEGSPPAHSRLQADTTNTTCVTDSPQFMWQISFVTSRRYSAARVNDQPERVTVIRKASRQEVTSNICQIK